MQNESSTFSHGRATGVVTRITSRLRERIASLSRSTVLVYTGLLLLIGFNLWGNLYWIDRNVTLLGRDAGGHLTRTLQYAAILERITPQTLFEAITYHHFRPPALYLVTQFAYALFGVSMDAAQMVNVALLVAILGLTFVIGRHVADDRTALFAVLLTGLFPMTAAMTRLFYLENFQTAMVLLALLALLLGKAFRHRGWSLVWGISIGVGLLVKWSMPAYLVVPSLIALWKRNWFRAQWDALRRPRVDLRTLAIALGGAVVVAGLWYWPNRVQAADLMLGSRLFVVWIALLTPAFYALARPSRPLTNAWAGACIGLFIGSLWYAARPGFIDPLIDSAYGTYGGNYGAYNPLRLENYTRNPAYLVTHHLGLLGAVLILPAGLSPWLRRWRGWRDGRLGAWLLWGSIISTYIFTATTSQDGERNLVALLPVLAVLFADSLRRYRRPIALSLGAAWIVVLGLQWSLFTFDELAPLHEPTERLWARGEFLKRPASGITDPGFWIAPDVLGTIQANYESKYGPKAIFGMLINSIEIHRGPYHYLIKTEYPDVDLLALTEDESGGWARTVRSEWVLAKDGDNHDVDPEGLRALAEVYGKPDGIFPLLFERIESYPLPNGETATLWRRTVGPRYLPEPSPELQPLAETLHAWLAHRPLLLTTREQALWLGLYDLAPDRVQMIAGARPEASTVFVLRHRGRAGDEETLAWLNQHYYLGFGSWFDSEFLAIYGRPTGEMATVSAGHRFGSALLRSVTTQSQIGAGTVLPVELTWDDLPPEPLKASLRLLDGDGEPVAQLDRDVKAAMQWGLYVPPDTAPGEYTLSVSVYDPDTLEPVPAEGAGALVELTSVRVTR